MTKPHVANANKKVWLIIDGHAQTLAAWLDSTGHISDKERYRYWDGAYLTFDQYSHSYRIANPKEVQYIQTVLLIHGVSFHGPN